MKKTDGSPDPRAGKMNWPRAISEWSGAILIGSISMGVGTYFHLDPNVTGGLTGALCLVGAATIGEIVAGGLKKRVDALAGGDK
jgi:hypothetical protein